MTAEQRRRSAQQLATLEAQTRHSTQIATYQGAFGITSAPVMTLAELLALDVESRKAAWLTLDRSTKVAIAIERLTDKEIFFDRSDIEYFINGLDAKAQAAAVEAEALALAAAQVEPPALATERSIALAAGDHELDDRDLQDAYVQALAHSEMQTSRWQNALHKAYDHLSQETAIGMRADGAYFWTPDRTEGGHYAVTPAHCQCFAFDKEQPCKHRAAAVILSFLPVADEIGVENEYKYAWRGVTVQDCTYTPQQWRHAVALEMMMREAS